MTCSSIFTNGSTPEFQRITFCDGTSGSITLPDSAGAFVDGRVEPKTIIRDASMVVNVVSIGKSTGNFSIGACDFYGGPTYVYDARQEEKRLPLVQVVKGQCTKFMAFVVSKSWGETRPPEDFTITVEFWLLSAYCKDTISDFCLLNHLPGSSAPRATKSYALVALTWLWLWLVSAASS